MSCDKKERFGIKRGNGVPTIPASSDHRNGDWMATDIYEGEMYQDTDTGVVYTRSGTSITESNGSKRYTTWTGLMSQTGTGAPTLDAELNNSLGGSIVFTYLSAGSYRGTLSSAFSTQNKFFALVNTGNANGILSIRWENANSFFIITRDFTGASANSLLSYSHIEIKVYQ